MTAWPAAASADTCPVCGADHRRTDPGWSCPRHGHELQYHGTTEGGHRYACPAHRCHYERTRQSTPRRTGAPMTTGHSITIAHPPAPGTELMLRRDQDFWDQKQLAALRQIGVENAPNPELAVFFHYCQRTQLDPFARQITMIKRRERDGDGWRDRWTIQIGIDGYRLIARRAASERGQILSYGDPTWYDADGKEYPVWVRDEPPAAAKVTVYVDGATFPGIARYKAFVALHPKTGKPMGQWADMPDHMIAKCAEAQALRRAFPHDLGDTQTTDETHAAGTTPWHVTAADAERRRNRGEPPPAETPSNEEAELEAPHDGRPAPKNAVTKLEDLLSQLQLGTEEDIRVLLEWQCGEPYKATRSQAQLVTTYLQDHLETAQGDTAAAADAIWRQYRAVHDQDAAAEAGDGDG